MVGRKVRLEADVLRFAAPFRPKIPTPLANNELFLPSTEMLRENMLDFLAFVPTPPDGAAIRRIPLRVIPNDVI